MSHTCAHAVKLEDDLPPEVAKALEQFFHDYSGTLDGVRRTLTQAIRDGDVDPSSTGAVSTFVERSVGNYSADIETVFRDGVERGAEAGRALSARRHALDIDFDVVPQRTLDVMDDWAMDASKDVVDRLGDDITSYVRAAHEEGIGVDDLADQLNDELFENRLQDWEAERVARTNTIPSSNAGSHSAHVDADGVVGERWVTALDGRQRETHGDADGQIVAVDGTFLVGGYEATHPGDPGLPPEEIINCRCRVVPVFRDELTDSEFAQLESGGRLNAAAPTSIVA